MAGISETVTLRVKIEDLSDLTSSRLLSMAEAALDACNSPWREWDALARQEIKDEVAMALFEAALKNPVGQRCGVAMSEAGHDEQFRPPHNEGL